MTLAEIARSRRVLGTAAVAFVGTMALRAPHRAPPAAPAVIDVPDHRELTMQIQDCASDVQTVGGHVRVTLRLGDSAHCDTQVRVYHLENDHLVFDRHD